MINHVSLARLFLICLTIITSYTMVSDKSPTEVKLLPCLFQTVTDVPCPGCGMTRACLSLTHGHFTDAWHYHPFSFPIIGLAIGIALFPSLLINAWKRLPATTQNYISICSIVLCLSMWLIKLKPLIVKSIIKETFQ